jgi:hypothetical protein
MLFLLWLKSGSILQSLQVKIGKSSTCYRKREDSHVKMDRGRRYPRTTKAFVGFSQKLTCRKIFPALICHPSGRKCIHLQTGVVGGGGGRWRKTQKLLQKVSDGKRSLSIIHVNCRLIQLVNGASNEGIKT